MAFGIAPNTRSVAVFPTNSCGNEGWCCKNTLNRALQCTSCDGTFVCSLRTLLYSDKARKCSNPLYQGIVCSDHRRWLHSEKHARLCLFLATSRASLIANRISCSALKSSNPYRRALEARLVLFAFLHNSIYANVSSFTGESFEVGERCYFQCIYCYSYIYRAAC
jgi:hypothetical protein